MTSQAGPWVIEVPAPAGRVWSVNTDHGAHHYEVARHRKQVRRDAALAAKAVGIPNLGRCRVEVDVYTSRPRTSDPANYAGGSTVKAAVDALVDAGVIPDDNWRFADVRMPRMHPLGGRPGRVVLTVSPWPDEDEVVA